MAAKKVFSTYYNPQKKDNELVVLEEKFSFLAFLFPFMYALKNSMNLFGLYLFIVQVVIFFISSRFPQLSNAPSLLFSIISGAFATDLYVFYLRRNDYKLRDIVYAESEMDAEIMFYSRIHNVRIV